MKISRHGTTKYHGMSSIEFKKPTFSWNPAEPCITIKQSDVKDFSGDSNHNYIVCLSLDEMRSLLIAISEAAISGPPTFAESLEPLLKRLLQLQAVIVGAVR